MGSPRPEIALTHQESGDGGPTLLVLHGFMGSMRSMAGLVDAMSTDRRVVAVDLVGHGASPAPPDVAAYRAAEMVEQLRALLRGLDLEHVDVVGYSMGARLALSFVATVPEMVGRLVSISGTPGIADQADRESRVRGDAAMADEIEQDGIAAFVDAWEQLPMFASQLALPRAVKDSIRAGRLAQRQVGLANSLRGFGTGSMPSLWDRLEGITVPTLAISGELDRQYVAVALQMETVMPNGRADTVTAAGHATHTEAPEDTVRLIRAHLQR